MDGRDALDLHPGPTGRLAGNGLRCSQRFRANPWDERIAHTRGVARPRRKMETAPLGGRLVSLARGRTAGVKGSAEFRLCAKALFRQGRALSRAELEFCAPAHRYPPETTRKIARGRSASGANTGWFKCF